jgi:nitrobindin-like protein
LALDHRRSGRDDARVNDDLKPLSWIIGTWEGEATGQPGRGTQQRRYEAVLRGEFVMGTNRTTWTATDAHPEGETHEDIAIISYDRAARRFVMHVFYVERFVAAYVGEQTGPDVWVFTAEGVQNGPPGMRSREIFTHRGDEFESRFELAMAGKDFAPYTREVLRRVG